MSDVRERELRNEAAYRAVERAYPEHGPVEKMVSNGLNAGVLMSMLRVHGLKCVDCGGNVTFRNLEFCGYKTMVRCYTCQSAKMS